MDPVRGWQQPAWAGLLGLFLWAACASAPPSELVPDQIFFNGKVVTVDADFSIQQAFALREDRFLAVGDQASILAMAGPQTRRWDLKGHTVIPGLIDSHHHLLSKAVDQYLGVEVALVGSLREMLAALRRKCRETPAGEVIFTTSGWLVDQLQEGRPPARTELDEACPHHPVIVQGGHTLYLNSAALRKAGIRRETPSPAGGLIEKDETGEPTGLLVDNAMALARPLFPKADFQVQLAALKEAQFKENSVGITGIREPGLSPQGMRVYQALWKRGELTLRVSMNLHLDPQDPFSKLEREVGGWGVSTRFGNEWLRLDGIGEFGIDGGFEGALFSQPYPQVLGREGGAYFGLQRIPQEKFRRSLRLFRDLGWRGSIHAVGDAGVDRLLAALEELDREKPLAGERWVLEHAHYTRPDQLAQLRRLGVAISTQFHPYMAAATMKRLWGEERAAQSMRVRDWLEAGLVVGGGSDWSLVPANPFWMIYFWVSRQSRLWGPLGEEQRISREQALRMMTLHNAYLTFEEHLKGSIERGKLADFVILSEDLLTVPQERIPHLRPLATVLGGRLVYGSLPLQP